MFYGVLTLIVITSKVWMSEICVKFNKTKADVMESFVGIGGTQMVFEDRVVPDKT